MNDQKLEDWSLSMFNRLRRSCSKSEKNRTAHPSNAHPAFKDSCGTFNNMIQPTCVSTALFFSALYKWQQIGGDYSWAARVVGLFPADSNIYLRCATGKSWIEYTYTCASIRCLVFCTVTRHLDSQNMFSQARFIGNLMQPFASQSKRWLWRNYSASYESNTLQSWYEALTTAMYSTYRVIYF